MKLINDANTLSKYYQTHNPVVDRLKIKAKIGWRILGYIICTICYLIISNLAVQNSFQGEIQTSETLHYMKYIMIACYVIAGIGAILFIIAICLPHFGDRQFNKIPYKTKKGLFTFLDWFLIIPICCTIVVFTYSFLFIITPISGRSMQPNIVDNERVFVSYVSKPTRFDVVVLEVNNQENIDVYQKEYYIKRIIGLPGDKLTWINKVLTINGEIIDEYYFDDNYLATLGSVRDFQGTFKYKLNGVVLESNTIPEGYCFVMGDNRLGLESKDSRSIGLVPLDNIIGVAKFHMNGLLPGGKIS